MITDVLQSSLKANSFDAEGLVVWLTGRPSSGKSTLAQHISSQLGAEGRRVESLDGDAVRLQLCRDLGFTKADRDENVRRIGFVAELLARHGVIVVVSAISPYRAARDEIRQRMRNFIEVYVNAPLSVCQTRDVKGLYRKAATGELKGLTGFDAPYEAPLWPEIECRTDLETIEESASKVIEYLGSIWQSDRKNHTVRSDRNGSQDGNDSNVTIARA